MASLSFRIDVQGPDDSGSVNVLPVLLVDDAVVADFAIFGLDLNELVRSRAEEGEHFILTCWCGVPECARVDRGIDVAHRRGVVQWKTSFPMQPATLSFDATSYGRAIDDLLELLPRRWRAVSAEFERVELIPHGCDAFASARASGG
jgi:hypothetical protein